MTKIAKYTLFGEITQHILHYYVTKINQKTLYVTKIAKYTLFDEIKQHILQYYETKINHKKPICDKNSSLTQKEFIE